MASKHYYFYTLSGILLIGFSSFLASYFFFRQNNLLVGSLIVALVIIEIMVFVNSMNQINRKIATFFNAVHNQDTSIRLPENVGSKAIADIFEGMVKTLQVFQSVKMESQFKEKLFMAMIEHSTTGFISIDEYGDFEIMNETARKLLGVQYTSNIDRMKKISPELYETIMSLEPGESRSCRVIRPNLVTIVQVASSKLIYKDKKLTLVSLLDIQKEIDARELESWQKLIRIMNHEIMNSIAPITSASKSLMNIFIKKTGTVEAEQITAQNITDVTNCLEVIDTMSNGLSYFVENYRKLSKIPEPSIKEINIQKWGESLEKILRECINNTTLLEVKTNEYLKTFPGDERLLNQVIINLVKNADEAPKGVENKDIKVTLSPSIKGKIDIQVWNNGAPIDKENMDKIFIPFFSTKEDGAGIGLYLSKQIVNMQNGSLTVISDKDTGTVFNISI
ncbi:MAG: ATP-binding protein [Bacteroidales bacterium]|nr:ATP-binding protein [Bacteroidales bacterium]